MRGHLLCIAALSLLAACADEDRAGTEGTPANDRGSVATDDRTAPLTQVAADRPDTIVRRPAPASLSFGLLPMGSETLSGTVEAVAKGRSTSFAMHLRQGSAKTSYDATIRLGDCSRLGPTVASLVPATVDSLGKGESQSDVAIPMDSLVNTRMALVFGRAGRPASCGSIPERGQG